MNFLKFIFNVKKEQQYKVYTILGIKIKKTDIKYLLKENSNEILLGVKRIVAASRLHESTFGEFKNKYKNREIVLIGAGPTLNCYKPFDNVINVGLNRVFLNKDIDFDYIFAIDKAGIEQYYKEFFNYNKNCIKFIGDQNLGKNWQIPESIIEGENIRRYKTTALYMPSKFSLDINWEPLGNFNTVSLQAMQFILFTNPKKIYLVGIDCSQGQHFKGASPNLTNIRGENIEQLRINAIKYWKELKKFASIYYPNTEIISVNPVGLKGLFKDIYTDEYKKSLLK